MSPLFQTWLLHVLKLAALSAGVAVVAAVVAALGHFNLATIPVAYQFIAGALLPVIVGALSTAQQQLSAELAQEEAKNAQATAAKALAEASSAKNALATAEAKLAVVPVTSETKSAPKTPRVKKTTKVVNPTA